MVSLLARLETWFDRMLTEREIRTYKESMISRIRVTEEELARSFGKQVVFHVRSFDVHAVGERFEMDILASCQAGRGLRADITAHGVARSLYHALGTDSTPRQDVCFDSFSLRAALHDEGADAADLSERLLHIHAGDLAPSGGALALGFSLGDEPFAGQVEAFRREYARRLLERIPLCDRDFSVDYGRGAFLEERSRSDLFRIIREDVGSLICMHGRYAQEKGAFVGHMKALDASSKLSLKDLLNDVEMYGLPVQLPDEHEWLDSLFGYPDAIVSSPVIAVRDKRCYLESSSAIKLGRIQNPRSKGVSEEDDILSLARTYYLNRSQDVGSIMARVQVSIPYDPLARSMGVPRHSYILHFPPQVFGPLAIGEELLDLYRFMMEFDEKRYDADEKEPFVRSFREIEQSDKSRDFLFESKEACVKAVYHLLLRQDLVTLYLHTRLLDRGLPLKGSRSGRFH